MAWRPTRQTKMVQTTRKDHYLVYAGLNVESQRLIITVTDTVTQNIWQNHFAQMHFDKMNIYKVTKLLINAIQPQNITQKCKIIVHSNWCYLTIDSGKHLPSFALPTYAYTRSYWQSRNTNVYNRPTRAKTHSVIQTPTHLKANTNKPLLPPPVTLHMLAEYSRNGISVSDTYEQPNKLVQNRLHRARSLISLPPPPKKLHKIKALPPKTISEEISTNDTNSVRSDTSDSESSQSESEGVQISEKPSVKLVKSAPITSVQKPKRKSDELDSAKFDALTEIYSDYIQDKGEKPSNSFDLINFMMFNGIKGINFKDVGKFLMNCK